MSKPFNPDVLHYLRQYQRASLASIEAQFLRAKKPTAHTPILGRERRAHIIEHIVTEMRDWRTTAFEKEGPLVAGIRSALCLAGHRWEPAHREAKALVAQALRTLGVERPTWDQGQREYVDPRENCRWCQKPIPGELLIGRRSGGFCSAVCAQTAILRRNLTQVRAEALAYQDAREVVIRSRNPVRECVECGTNFRPMEPDGKFCSSACMGKSWTTHPVKACVHCGKSFRGRTSEADKDHFCSAECYRKHGRTTRYDRSCDACGMPFVAKLSHARCCSNRCASFLSRVRAGRPPKSISPQVFDYLFVVKGDLEQARC